VRPAGKSNRGKLQQRIYEAYPPTEIPLQVDLHLVAFLTPNTRNVGLEKLTGDSTQLGLSTSKRA